LAARRDYADAEPYFKAAVRLNPKFGLAYFWLGICAEQGGADSDAIESFRQALAETADTNLSAVMHYDLGVEYLKNGQNAAAQGQYRAAVALNPAFASRPLVLPPHPNAASPPAPPAPTSSPGRGPPLPYWLRFLDFALIVAGIGLAGFVLVKARRKQAAAPPAAPPVIQETGSWQMEPELLTAQPPRRLEFRGWRNVFAAPVVLAFGILLALFAANGRYEMRRWYILRHGVAGVAVLQRAYWTSRQGYRVGRIYQFHWVLAYEPPGERPQVFDAAVGGRNSVSPGAKFSVHYIAERPGWAALDDDYGQERKDLGLAAAILLTFCFILGIAAWKINKSRRILRWGRAVGAVVSALKSPYRGMRRVGFSYELDGRKLAAWAMVSARVPLQEGQVVTIVADPADPARIVVYQDASWRVAA